MADGCGCDNGDAALILAAMCRCMLAAGRTRITVRPRKGGTLMIVSVVPDAPSACGGDSAAALALIDRLAAQWGHRGNGRRRVLWALVGGSDGAGSAPP